MYRYIIKFSDGKHITGAAPTMSYCTAEIWELDFNARKNKRRIVNIDIWRTKR